MAEAEDVRLDLGHQAAFDKFAHGGDQVILAGTGHDREQIKRDAAAEYSGRVDDSPLRLRQTVEVTQHCLAHADRQWQLRTALRVRHPGAELTSSSRKNGLPEVRRARSVATRHGTRLW